jgi:hypothetical protein
VVRGSLACCPHVSMLKSHRSSAPDRHCKTPAAEMVPLMMQSVHMCRCLTKTQRCRLLQPCLHRTILLWAPPQSPPAAAAACPASPR